MKLAALNLFRRVDRHALLHHPRMWLLRPHWVLGASVVACLTALAFGLAYPVSASNVPSVETYFSIALVLTGLVSLFPVLLNLSLEAVLEKIPLDASIEQALCGTENDLGKLLEIVKCVEVGDLERVAALLEGVPLSRNQLQQALVNSAEWVADL